MAESSSQILSSPELIPKEEPDIQDRPESPNPFLPADQVEFTFDKITLSTKNEVALIYHSHPKSEYFKYTVKTLEGSKICVSTLTRGAKGTLRKSHLPLRWRLLMAQIIQCLGGKTGRVDQISNTDAIILYCLANGIKVDFSKISWEDIIQKLNKKTWEKVVPYPRFISLLLEYMMPEYDHEDLTINPTQVFNVLNWALKPNQPERTPFTDHMLAICNTDVHVENKAPKTSLLAENPGHPSASTPVVAEMHKEAQQETGDPTSLGPTSEEGINPQLNSDMSASKNNESIFFASTTFHSESTSGCDASTDSTAEADLGFSAPNDSMPQHQDEPIIVSDESDDKEDVDKNADTRDSFHTNPEDTSVPHPPSLKSVQLQELKNQTSERNSRHSLPMSLVLPPSQVSSVQEKLKALDALPSLLTKFTTTLNKFASIMGNGLFKKRDDKASKQKTHQTKAQEGKDSKSIEAKVMSQCQKSEEGQPDKSNGKPSEENTTL
ncbi:hypothetical protein Tco_1093643 [Tanacetum coccineum]|uniref:Uncharacterized protein n=1 Tax=Tanacetum coccineum TaxID=301880 RepID=A0ABQ5IDT1_9ASTR